MKSKIDSGRMMNRVASLQEENESLHAQIGKLKADNENIEKKRAILYKENEFLLSKTDELKKNVENANAEAAILRKKIEIQEKAIMRLKIICHNSQGLPIPEFEKKECREFLEGLYKEL